LIRSPEVRELEKLLFLSFTPTLDKQASENNNRIRMGLHTDNVMEAHEKVLHDDHASKGAKEYSKQQIDVLNEHEISEDDLGSLTTPAAKETAEIKELKERSSHEDHVEQGVKEIKHEPEDSDEVTE